MLLTNTGEPDEVEGLWTKYGFVPRTEPEQLELIAQAWRKECTMDSFEGPRWERQAEKTRRRFQGAEQRKLWSS